jgi:class 3 adenylate cyclase
MASERRTEGIAVQAGNNLARSVIAVGEKEIADEIRIIQSLQTQNYMPAVLFGNAYAVVAVLYVTWPAPVTSGAIYGFIALLTLLLPMVYSYFRIRGRPRPETVSRRRIRSIVVYSFLLGLAWAIAIYLMTSQISQSDGVFLLMTMFILIYGSLALMPNIPLASIAYISPIMLGSFASMYWNGLLHIDWLGLVYFGALVAVVMIIWKNWHDLNRSVRLRLENLQAHRITERVSGQLAKYISPQLYHAILTGEQEVSIASKRKKLTIFFSDIAGFTEVTDQLEPEELTALLNQYLTEMARIAHDYGAHFDKFIGDAIVLYFGDPETRGVKADASDCVRMAIAMQRRMKELRTEWRNAGLEKPFEVRIGINTGYCTVGNFGNEDHMDYTIIGGEVNLAARLEAESEAGGIMLANETYSLVKDWVMAEQAQTITVKGFPRPIKTFRVRGIYDDLAAEGRIIHHQRKGLSLIIDGDQLGREGRESVVEILTKALEDLKTQKRNQEK